MNDYDKTKTLDAVNSQLNGAVPDMIRDPLRAPLLHAVRTMAAHIDEDRAEERVRHNEVIKRLDRIGKIAIGIGTSVGSGVIVAVIIAALRLS